jgi:hypothetical protein
MAETPKINTDNRITRKSKPYVPAAQRQPPGEMTVLSRIARLLDRLTPDQRAGAVAWLSARYSGV